VPYLSDDLVTNAKKRAKIPAAQASWSSAEILSSADEQTQSYVIPLIRRTREDYGLQVLDFTLGTADAQGTTGPYRIPYRAVGGAIRDVYLADVHGNPINVPRITPDDLEQATWGVHFLGNALYFVNKTTQAAPVKLRMTYFMRPNRLVLQSGAAQVASFDPVTRSVVCTSVPTSYTGQTSFDLVQGRPGFDTLAYDFAGTVGGTTFIFASNLPSDLAVGDYVCLTETTPIPQVPPELHPLLAQRVAVQYLESEGDPFLERAQATLARMEADATTLLTPRIEGSPKHIIPSQRGPWRRWRR